MGYKDAGPTPPEACHPQEPARGQKRQQAADHSSRLGNGCPIARGKGEIVNGKGVRSARTNQRGNKGIRRVSRESDELIGRTPDLEITGGEGVTVNVAQLQGELTVVTSPCLPRTLATIVRALGS